MSLSSSLNFYDIYRKNYDLTSTNVDRLGETIIDGERRTYKRGMTMAEYSPFAPYVAETPAG